MHIAKVDNPEQPTSYFYVYVPVPHTEFMRDLVYIFCACHPVF